MAIDWSRIITIEDENTVQAICGKEILYLRGLPGQEGRGITNISKTSTSGLIDTYTIAYTDGTTSTFEVQNGESGTRSIASIEKTSSTGFVDTYTIYYTDNTTSTFQIRNADIVDVIAHEFDENEEYNVGDYVIHGGKLYKWLYWHPIGQQWIDNRVEELTVVDDLIKIFDKADQSIIAPEFDENEAYEVGDYVMYNDKLYKWLYDHPEGQQWIDNRVTEVTVVDGFIDASDKTDQSVIAPEFHADEEYQVDDFVMHGGKLYKWLYWHPFGQQWIDNRVEEVTVTGVFTEFDDSKKIDQKVIAPIFSASTPYDAGDYVIYKGKLYQFSVNHSAGEWDSSQVTERTVMERVDYNFDSITILWNSHIDKTEIAPLFSISTSYNTGDIVLYNDVVYRFNVSHLAGEAWNSAEVTRVTIASEITQKLDDAPSDDKIYGRKNGTWTQALAQWGEITGDINEQSDLIELINERPEVELYVDASTGSDDNDGSYGHPFATIGKAVKNASGIGKTEIFVAGGTYSEDVSISEKRIVFYIANTTTVNAFTLESNAKVSLLGADAVSSKTFRFDGRVTIENSYLYTENLNLSLKSSNASPFHIINSEVVIPNGNVGITENGVLYGIWAQYSNVYVNNIYINAGNFDILSQNGSVVCYGGYTSVGRSPRIGTGTGGRVYTGEQTALGSMASQDDVSGNDIHGRSHGQWHLLTDTFYTEDEVDALLDEKADKSELDEKQDIIIKKESGSSIEFTSELATQLAECIVDIDPVQETGGYAPGTKNLLPMFESDTITKDSSTATLVVDEYGNCVVNKSGGNSSITFYTTNTVTLEAGTYTLSLHNPKSVAGSNYMAVVLSRYAQTSSGQEVRSVYVNNSTTFTLESQQTYYVHLFLNTGDYTNFEFSPMLEVGSTSSPYQPYNHICPITGHTECNVTANEEEYEISFGSAGTVYKGRLNVLTGVLTVTYGEIASYNGETLSGIWMSDRDVYAEGTTPTIGAQVVYELATPQTYQLTPQEISAIIGTNTISADTGDIEIGYFYENSVPLINYIDDKLAEKQDLLTFDITPTADSDNPVTSAGIKTALDDKSDVITNSASGDIATFDDGADAPVADLTVAIEPVQDLHGYDHPYPAGGGKNLFAFTPKTATTNGVTFTWKEDGTVTATGTVASGSNAQQSVPINLPSGNYYYNGGYNSSNTCYIWCHTDNTRAKKWDGSTISDASFNEKLNEIKIEEGKSYVLVCYVNSNSSVNTSTFKPMICASTETDTSFAPYSNICPITGFTEAKITRTGKNEIVSVSHTYTTRGFTVTIQADGSLLLDGKYDNSDAGIMIWNFAYPSAISTNQCDSKKYLPNGTYRYVNTEYHGKWALQIYGSNEENPSSGSTAVAISNSYSDVDNIFTIDNTYKYTWVRLWISAGIEAHNEIIHPMIVKTDEYDNVEVSFPTEAGTVYGGNLDITTGMLTIDMVSETFTSCLNIWSGSGVTTADLKQGVKAPSAQNIIGNVISSYLKTTSITQMIAEKGYCIGINRYSYIVINIPGLTSKAEYNAYLTANPLQVVYELAEPITYQLAPQQVTTLLGQNTIFADTGAVDVTYRADTKTYVDEKVESSVSESETATRTMITQSSESAMVATKNYNTGDLMIINNQLLRATANIATSGEITIGTNAEIVDLDTVISEKVSNSYLNNLINVTNDGFQIKSIPGATNTSETFTVSTGARIVLFVLDSSSQNLGSYIIVSTGTGVVSFVPILSASNLSLSSPSSGKITISKINGSYGFLYVALVGYGTFSLDS